MTFDPLRHSPKGTHTFAVCQTWIDTFRNCRERPPWRSAVLGHAAPPTTAGKLRPFSARFPTHFVRYRKWLFVAILPLLALCVGCGEDLDTSYGRRSGVKGGKSVNGTGAFSEMFRQAGHEVHTWRWLSPRLDEADVIVWAPDDFEPPSPKAREWLEDWLLGDSHGDDWRQAEGSRTLIYIGRDFDAGPSYWKKVLPLAPADKKNEFTRRLKETKLDESFLRSDLPASTDADWFNLDSKPLPRAVTTLEGPWAQDIDATKLEMQLGARLEPPKDESVEILLSSTGDTLVSRSTWESDYYSGSGIYAGSLIVVVNGSFLLNYQLINHEHRKLAGKLIDAVGPPELNVVFLESSGGGPPIRDHDPETSLPSWLSFFTVWPINFVVLQLALLGVIFCFARWPIFGVPRELPPGGTTDFGKHITALGQLLAKTGDRDYAATRLSQYEQIVSGESKAGEEKSDS